MIVGKLAYELAQESSIDIPSCALGENILLDFDPHKFVPGTIFAIGNAQIEITKACTLCSHLSKYDKKLPKLILNYRGQYCKVIKSGEIKRGDRVYLIKNSINNCSKLI